MTESLDITKIVRDGGTQSRAALNESVIAEYTKDMRNGDQFPAVDIFYDGSQYILTDGFHRVAAAERAGLKTIDANVLQGTLMDAQWVSYGVNAHHGLRRSNEDKRRAIIAALKHPNGAGKSDREIGRHVGVDHKTITSYREQLELSGEIPQIEQREVTRNGTTYTQDTASIGHQTGTSKFGVGDIVRTRTNHVGTVERINGSEIWVSTTNGTTYHRSEQLSLIRKGSAIMSDEDFRLVMLRQLYDFNAEYGSGRACIMRISPDEQQMIDEGLLDVYYAPNHVGKSTPFLTITPKGCELIGRTPVALLPVADDQATTDELARDEQISGQANTDQEVAHGWKREISPNGILSAASRVENWDSLNWIGRWRELKRIYCPNQADDPLLFARMGNGSYVTLDADAEACVASIWQYGDYERHAQARCFSCTDDGLEALQRAGASGVLIYREVNIDPSLLDERNPAPDDPPEFIYGDGRPVSDNDLQAWSYNPVVEKREDEIADRLYALLHNFSWDELEQLPVALERIMLFLNRLYPISPEVFAAIAVWREFVDRVQATADAEEQKVVERS